MLGFKSVAKAEEAAYSGEGAKDWDSQNCRDFQQAVLSSPYNSSPPREKRNAVASNTARRLEIIGDDEELEDDHDDDKLQLDLLPRDWAAQDLEKKQLTESGSRLEIPPQPEQDIGEKGAPKEQIESLAVLPPPAASRPPPPNGTQGTQFKKVLRKDSKGRLRLFDHEGNIVEPTQRPVSKKTMEEDPNSNGTQKSSMSLTQENHESAYDAYKRKRAQSSANHSPASERNHPSAYMNSKNQSLYTDSTAHTYGENDTGHIAFDLDALDGDLQEAKDEPEDMGEQEEEDSQEHLYSPPKFAPSLAPITPYAPETPAPAINPFGDKGVVMNPLDLFKTTQASSMARPAFHSPTSSRPSPNIYNEFNTPGIPSSPTAQRAYVAASSAPPAMDLDFAASISQSPAFRSAPENPQTSPIQPRAYVSMKESQEKRRREEAEAESDSDGSISSVEPVAAKKRERIDRVIERELSAVSVPAAERRDGKEHVSHDISSPVEATTMVEVPSTSKNSTSSTDGRRRSIQDDYLAQCTGSDARDTQQDSQHVVADSQVLPEAELESGEIAQSLSHVAESSLPQIPKPSPHGHPSPTAMPSQFITTTPDLPPSQMLPPLGGCEAINNFDDATIPETSPIRSDRIRPMGDIASFRADSFSAEDVDVEEYPGFTQDVGFDEAIGGGREPSHSRKSSQIRASRKSPQPSAFRRPPVLRDSPETSLAVNGSISESPPDKLSATVPSPRKPPSKDSSISTSASKIPPNRSLRQRVEVEEHESIPIPAEVAQSLKPLPAKIDNLKTIVPASSESPSTTPTPFSFKVPPRNAPQAIRTSNTTPDTDEVKPSAAPQLKQQDDSSLNARTSVPAAEPVSSALSSLPDMDTDDEIDAAPEESDTLGGEDNPESSENAQPNEDDLPVLPISTPVVLKSKKLVTYGKSSSSKKSRRAAKDSSPTQDDLANSSPTVAVAPKVASKAKVPPKKRSVAQKSPPREESPVPTQTRKAKRKSALVLTETEAPATTRSFKRKSTGHNLRDSSEDPIALGTQPTSSAPKKKTKGLFSNMAFAVSYVSAESERAKVTKLIRDNGGQILEDGFDTLFNKSVATSSSDAKELQPLPSAARIGFVALIANQHSRRAKYMQALALGLPCISGKWIDACLAKDFLLDWSVYLLCAGQSTLLGDACRSRTLQVYSAADAKFVNTFEQRDQFLNGKSILVVTGNAKRLESRNAYVFLTRALGPSRIGHAVDLQEARKKLADAERNGTEWDMVYVDNDKGAEATLFGNAPLSGSRKRKRASTAASDDIPTPKRIRVICDETVVQSLILGQLMEE